MAKLVLVATLLMMVLALVVGQSVADKTPLPSLDVLTKIVKDVLADPDDPEQARRPQLGPDAIVKVAKNLPIICAYTPLPSLLKLQRGRKHNLSDDVYKAISGVRQKMCAILGQLLEKASKPITNVVGPVTKKIPIIG